MNRSYEYFASGNNFRGKLGIGSNDTQRSTFTPPLHNFDEEFKNVAAGENHAMAVTASG